MMDGTGGMHRQQQHHSNINTNNNDKVICIEILSICRGRACVLKLILPLQQYKYPTTYLEVFDARNWRPQCCHLTMAHIAVTTFGRIGGKISLQEQSWTDASK